MSKLSALEAILFIYGEPISIKKIGGLLELGEEEAEKLIENFRKSISEENRGVMLIGDNENIQIVTKPEFGNLLEKIIKSETREDISQAAQETLAIVAYMGPVERSKIEYIRGVNSSFTLRNLLVRGLIERDKNFYKLTNDALRHLGVSKIEELPEYEKHSQLLSETTQKLA